MRISAALAVFMLFSACQPAPPPEFTEADRAAIAEEVMEVAQGLRSALAANDFEAQMTAWAENAGAYWVGDPAMYLNRLVVLTDVEAIRAYWEPAMEGRSANNLMPSEEYVAVLSPDVALHVYEGDWSVADTTGAITGEGRITGTTVFVREDGEWRQIHYHQSWDTATSQ